MKIDIKGSNTNINTDLGNNTSLDITFKAAEVLVAARTPPEASGS